MALTMNEPNEAPKEGCRKMGGGCNCPVNECFFERAYPLQQALQATKPPPPPDLGATTWDVELEVKLKIRVSVPNTWPEEEIWETAIVCIPDNCSAENEDL